MGRSEKGEELELTPTRLRTKGYFTSIWNQEIGGKKERENGTKIFNSLLAYFSSASKPCMYICMYVCT
jgi:hypothetical protein